METHITRYAWETLLPVKISTDNRFIDNNAKFILAVFCWLTKAVTSGQSQQAQSSAMNQSELEAKTRDGYQARENLHLVLDAAKRATC